MKTIRKHVFETNSSSEHCVTVSDTLRTADEFPTLTADGVLEIEAKIKWECGQDGTFTDDLRDILDYLCILAYHLTPWQANADHTQRIRDTSYQELLSEVQSAYTDVGLEPPKSIYYYYTDTDGNRHTYAGQDGVSNCIWAPDRGGMIEAVIDGKWMWFTSEDLARFEHNNPDKVAKCIRTKYPFGINHNLLWGKFSNIRFDERDDGETDYGIEDLLHKRFTLHFYRT